MPRAKTNIWKCRKCGKEFAKPNQSHKCERVSIGEVFANKEPVLFELYNLFRKRIQTKGQWIETTSKKAITFYTESRKAFLGVSLKKTYLDIWFNLPRPVDELPVYRIVKPTKAKFGHFVRLYDATDVDSFLMSLIAEAYDLVA